MRILAPPPPLPSAPQSLSAVANSSTSVSLAWSAAAGAVRYVVEQLVGDAWSLISTVSSEVTLYTISNLVADTQYAFQVRASNISGVSPGSPIALVRTSRSIDDPLIKGKLAFAAPLFDAQETVNGGEAVLAVERTVGRGGIVSVSYSVAASSATAGEDFEPVTGVLTFEAGETSKTIAVPLVADTFMEAVETFVVTLASPGGGAELGEVTSATVRIIDNDPRGAIAFTSANSVIDESTGSHAVSVIRIDGAVGAIAVHYALGNPADSEDLQIAAGILEFADGETSKTISVIPVNDGQLERDEAVRIVLSNPTGGATIGELAEHVITVIDDEPFVPIKATYVGLLRNNGSLNGAAVQFKTTPSGAVTGKIMLDGRRSTFVGTINEAGQFVASFGRTKSDALTPGGPR